MKMPTSGELLVIITLNGEVRYKKSVESSWDRTTAVEIDTLIPTIIEAEEVQE